MVEQKLETSEVISATPSKRSRTKQKSIKGTTPEENPVTTVKINKTSHKKETVVGMLIVSPVLIISGLENYCSLG